MRVQGALSHSLCGDCSEVQLSVFATCSAPGCWILCVCKASSQNTPVVVDPRTKGGDAFQQSLCGRLVAEVLDAVLQLCPMNYYLEAAGWLSHSYADLCLWSRTHPYRLLACHCFFSFGFWA